MAPSAGGFSLVELVGVLVLLTVLSAVATPALRSIDKLGASATRERIAANLRAARAAACAGAAPTGVSFDLPAQTLRIVRYDESDGQIEAYPGAEERGLGGAGGVLVVSVEGPPTDVVWFGFEGEPEARDAQGRLIGPLGVDALIELGDGSTVVARARTGLIE